VALLALAAALLLFAPCASAGPMLGGGDTRDPGAAPLVAFEGPLKVRPGEGGVLAFTITNRYNQPMDAVRVGYAFSVGGEWLDAREINASFSEPPRFTSTPPSLAPPIAPNASARFELPFATTPGTPGGVYLVSLTLVFQYVNSNGSRLDAHFVSLGSVAASDRGKVNMADYNGTLDRIGADGVVPDSSITVDSGQSLLLWLTAAVFGTAVVAVGVAYGLLSSRRARHGGR
jgi:hypothetical protein